MLITGASGHIGFRTLRYLLEYGYQVRAAVRSSAKADKIRSNPTLQGISEAQLSFIVVPDFVAAGALDKAAEGVKYIVHVASPIPFRDGADPADQEEHFVKPAIQGTVNILESALRAGTVKRVVITSSLVVNTPVDVQFGMTSSTHVYVAEDRIEMPETPYANAFVAYIASKVGSLAAAEQWIKDHPNAGFDAVYIHPAYTIGRDDLVLTSKEVNEGTNSAMLETVLGTTAAYGKASCTVHVDDTARVHALALKSSIPGNQSYLTVSEGLAGTTWQDSRKYVQKHFPEAVADGTLPNNGEAPTVYYNTDASKTEKVFGIVHQGYEEQVVSVVGHYLELLKKGL